ncbi:DUF6151 family protein [Primorskyibacter sp. S87]|uniref:DUF6151 family protein n=1 Tax=Primorskyibacter sp. S87 TaxID=3415126 RepID=UPI003C7BBFD0
MSGADGNAPTTPLAFSCDCGTVRGELSPVRGNHVVCYCPDCRAAELHLGRPDPATEPADLFQTAPDTVTFTQGADHLAVFRLSPKGPLRWYADCCNAPLFNTLASPKLAFSTLHTKRVEDQDKLGPIVIRVSVPQPDGTRKTEGKGRMISDILGQMLMNRITGRWKQTPFFDPGGAPVADVYQLTKAERAALYPSGRS